MNFAYLLLGIVVGVFSGFVGIGGGILIVPALVYLFHMDQHRAQGTSLGALLAPIGALAFWEYYKAGNVDIKVGLFIALGFLVRRLFWRALGAASFRTGLAPGVWNFAGNHWHPATTATVKSSKFATAEAGS